MISINLYLCLVYLGILTWLPIRIHGFWKLGQKDSRKFPLMLIWPILNVIHFYGLKSWLCHPALYQTLSYVLLAAFAIDVFYYLLMKPKQKTRMPLFSALGMVPFAFGYWLLHKPANDALELVLPHHGKALVWHRPLFNANTYHFMRPQSQAKDLAKAFEDPNYGQAIFSPCAAQVVTFDAVTSMLELAPQAAPDSRLLLGPFLPESLRVNAGDGVVANQPLGLQRESGSLPGIQLIVEGPRSPAFIDYLGGRLWARPFKRGRLIRNQFVISQHKGRFRLQPGSGAD